MDWIGLSWFGLVSAVWWPTPATINGKNNTEIEVVDSKRRQKEIEICHANSKLELSLVREISWACSQLGAKLIQNWTFQHDNQLIINPRV